MKLAIIQPSYIPWRGYFHQIRKADVFMFYDDVQYDERGWRNRNRIKTARGPRWLTIPVFSQGVQVTHTPIREVRIAWDRPWSRKHWESLRHSYSDAPFFARYAPLLADFYSRRPELLADFTIELTLALAQELGLTQTRFLRSSSLPGISGTGTERLLGLMRCVGADHYISGPSARAYIDAQRVAEAGVTIEYMSYDRLEYPEYEQLHPPYEPRVSILDLLFMKGGEAGEFIWGSRNEAGPQ